MIVPLNFDGPEPFVWDTELADLPSRTQAAWAAFCVGTVGPLLPPSYHDRFPFRRCVRAAWDLALGRPFDRDEIARLYEELLWYGEILGQTERHAPDDHPGWWVCGEGYELEHVTAPGMLLEVVLQPQRRHTNAMNAAESAGRVYQRYQFARQGFSHVVEAAYPYADHVTNLFYAMTRRAHEAALAHAGEPTEAMFPGVDFPDECEPLPPDLAAASRGNKVHRQYEQWIRDTGRWRGPW